MISPIAYTFSNSLELVAFLMSGALGLDGGKQLSSEEIKNIVLEYKRQGRPNKEIYGDFRLKNVKEYVIRGILAAHTKGVYNK